MRFYISILLVTYITYGNGLVCDRYISLAMILLDCSLPIGELSLGLQVLQMSPRLRRSKNYFHWEGDPNSYCKERERRNGEKWKRAMGNGILQKI